MTLPPATPLPSPKDCRKLREALSWSQAEVAAKLGVTRDTVRSWEAGRTMPRGRKRDKYAKLLALMAAEQQARAEEDAAVGDAPRHPYLDGPQDAPPRSPTFRRPRDPLQRAPKPPGAPARHAPDPAAPDLVGAAPSARPGPVRPGSTFAAGAAPDEQDAQGPTPAEAFDALYAHSAHTLVRQTYVLTGRRGLAQEAVERAFAQAWQRWPEVAVDRDPVGWVRAVAYEYAMSPWHRFRPGNRQPEPPPVHADDRRLLAVLLSLPPSYRRTLLLYDGIGLDLPETAAETEASTPAAASRLLHAREAVAASIPELADPGTLRVALTHLARGEKLQPTRPTLVRTGSECRTRFWTRAAIAFTALIIGATTLTLRTAPTQYDPPQAPGSAVEGVPPRMGPGPLSLEQHALRAKLTKGPMSGPYRLLPQPE